jgi:hypothetical protein
MLPVQPSALETWDQPCPRCGGSGVLRLDGQRWRTCLDCLGQGRITLLRPATTTAALHQAALQQPDVPGGAPPSAPPVTAPPVTAPPLSAPVSSAAR